MKKKKSRKTRFKYFCYLCAVIFVLFALLKYTDNRIMPSVAKTMEAYGTNISTRAIDTAVKKAIVNSGITAQDLYTRTIAENGRLTSLSANTVLINSICAEVAEEAMEELERLGDKTVNLPLGIVTGMDFLATKGPPVFKITVKPAGNCIVDYETAFKSEGINQVNYQIWLELRASIAVVNPVMSRSFLVERRLPVVNTYISGDVPSSMLYPFKIE